MEVIAESKDPFDVDGKKYVLETEIVAMDWDTYQVSVTVLEKSLLHKGDMVTLSKASDLESVEEAKEALQEHVDIVIERVERWAEEKGSVDINVSFDSS